jgi:hypothetical protein
VQKNVQIFNCRPPTELTNKINVKVRLSKPKLISNGFFRKNTFMIGIFSEPMSWKASRSYDDFKWLHECLTNRFPANFIPELPEVQAVENARDLDKYLLATYINQVVNSPDLVYSPELCSFLKLDEREFNSIK